ncbi:MAG: DedA family protein [Verrucomicrobia bacterium]|nr:DedA family protein [Verrucomicrobiota bacterium]
MFGFAKKIYEWASRKANSPFAPLWLGVLFFLELVFILPMDAILLLFCLENPKRRYLYALVATVGSISCAVVGYFLGKAAWDFLSPYVLDRMISTSFFERICNHYLSHQHPAVFVGSLLPIPFKAVTLSAGVCKLALLPFLGMVLLARSARFFLIAKVVQRWGVQIKSFVDKHFHRFIVAVGAKIALALTFFWALS